MKVMTLNPAQLAAESRRLAEAIARHGPFDITIGILNGGARVARAVTGCGLAGTTGIYCEVTLRRPSTARKERSGATSLLKRLPYPALNLMRMAESLVLRLRTHKAREIPALPEPLLHAFAAVTSPRVLIIDDAIDSGATMLAVVEAVRRAAPGARITTAALTVTFPNPMIPPDVALHRNGTLLRFPWSNDYKPCDY